MIHQKAMFFGCSNSTLCRNTYGRNFRWNRAIPLFQSRGENFKNGFLKLFPIISDFG
jgi:hypothetical protein